MTEKTGRRRTTKKASRKALADTPTGTVTFLFTDIEGSTALWENYPAQMQEALARHDEILRAAVEASGGYVFKTIGDACCAAFATAEQALQATLAAQRALFAEEWPGEVEVKVRMALHTGVAEEREGDYFGPPVNRVARLLSTGHGGQILLSGATYNLVRDVLVHMEPEAELRDLGEHRLKDLRYTEHVFQLVVSDLPAEFPPLRTAGLVTPAPGPDTPEPAPAGPPPPKETPRRASSPGDGRYRRLRPMGSGGMAEVYLAHDEVIDRDVALKVLRKQYAQDEQFVERFEREAKSAGSLSHPNIVAVHDLGETEDGAYYIVMECMPGGTLKERIEKEGALPPSEAIELALQIARGLQAAHRRGVIHRDIKPQNVLLNESGEAKVADFGIARAASSSTLTKTGGMMGTPHYVSPEVAQGRPASPRSDLYSLGVVLYEMLTGKLPYEAETPVGVVMKHVSEPLRPPREVNPSVPEGINAVCVKLLAKDSEERYQDADGLIEDLEQVKRGELPAFLAAGQQQALDGETVLEDEGVAVADGGATVLDVEDTPVGPPGAPRPGGRPEQEAKTPPGNRGTVPTRERDRSPHTPQAPPSRNKTTLLLASVIGVVLLLLVGGGAMALGFGLGTDWRGGSKNDPANENPPGQPSDDPSNATSGTVSPPSGAKVVPAEDSNLEDELRAAVTDYYKAVDRQDWEYTYDELDSQTQQRYTRNEYIQKNQYLARVDPLVHSSPRIVSSDISPSTVVEVTLTQTFSSGATRSRETFFVYEDGSWKHRFSREDDAIFLPGTSYEEFVRAKQSGS